MEQNNLTNSTIPISNKGTEAAPSSASQVPPIPSYEQKDDQPKASKAPTVISVITSILAIAGVAFGIYGMMQSTNNSNDLSNLKIQVEDGNGTISTLNTDEIKISNEQSTITITDSDSSDTEVRDLIENLYSTVITQNGQVMRTYDSGVLYKPENAKAFIPLEKTYGIVYNGHTVESVETSNKTQQITSNKLQELGFTKMDIIVWGDPIFYINNNSNIVCSLSGGNSSFFEASCGSTGWISEETISLANQLSDAMYTVTNKYPETLRLNKHTEAKNSTISPYQTLMVGVENAVGLFYRTSPEAEWKWFTGTQALVPCESYNTQDLKNAFAGAKCYEESTGQDSTVQP